MIVQRMVVSFICCVLLVGMMTVEIVAQRRSSAGLIIDHNRYIYAQRRGFPLAIDATITSPAGVRKAEVLCRPAGAREFTALPMKDRGGNVYRAVIPDWMTAGEGLEYYITATDQLGRSASHGFVGFPLLVRFSRQQPTREERLKALQDTLNIIRKSRETQGSKGYGDPLQDSNR